uniref:Laminin, alpha 3 n=1 Tax=Callorhinchus milii TaxID=7868 RepID=A0A4W3GYD5_CALMI
RITYLLFVGYESQGLKGSGPGYYRERLGFYLGRCVPCRCNRHSDKCLDRSGICVECKDNTEGDHCERCKPGFYGNGVQSSCSPCPCPLTVTSNNFATGCAENNGRLQCFCKPGYSGENCERCAPGYFGNPAEVGGQCRPCQCGNSNPTNCDPLTGQCGTCPGNNLQRGLVCFLCYVEDVIVKQNNFLIVNLSVLDHIKNKLAMIIDENKDLVDKMKNDLSLYQSKLLDLQDAMTEAANLTKKADDLNRINTFALDNIKVWGICKRKSPLALTFLTFKCNLMIVDSSQFHHPQGPEYEKQGAELDGAFSSLNTKVNQLSDVSSKEPIVIRAEKHAEDLNQLANSLDRGTQGWHSCRSLVTADCSLDDMLRDSNDKLHLCSTFQVGRMSQGAGQSGIWTRSGWWAGRVAQENDINKTLSRAKEVARGANDTVAKVMDKLQPILSDLENLNTITGNIPNLDDFNHALREAEDSVNILTNTLPSLVQKLNNLSKSQPANNISENIDRIRELIEQAREAANKVCFPQVFNGKSGVEVRLPNDLNDLKAYNSLVLYLKRPSEPARGDNRQKRQPDQDMFVLYLGHKNVSEYIGMALVDKKLVTVYKLGKDKEAKIESDLTVSTAVFDNAEFKRKNDVSSNTTYFPVSNGKGMLLTLDPQNTVFYVGGYPSNFTPPASLKYDNFIGDIELGVLNERLVSLYNFRETFNLNTTIDKPDARYYAHISKLLNIPVKSSLRACVRSIKVNSGNKDLSNEKTVGVSKRCSEDLLVSTQPKFSAIIRKPTKHTHYTLYPVERFETSSQHERLINVNLCFKADTNANSFFLLHSRSKFSVDVRTVTSEGIIFYVADKAERSYMALYILKGRFFFSFVVDGIKLKIKSKAKYNDGQWHTVVFSREGNTGKLVIDGLRTRQSSITTSSSLEVESPFYLGGLPSGKGQDSFQGCIRNFKLDGSQLSVPSRMLGVTPCFDGKSEPGAYFSAEGGYVILDNAFVVGRDFELLFEVRARSQTGVLFHISSPQGNYLSLYMHKGKVTVSVNNGAGEFSTSVDPQQSLCDGQSHRIAVDGSLFARCSLVSKIYLLFFPQFTDAVQTPHLPVRTPFIGCMQSVVINEKPVTFSKAAEVYGAVSLTRCPTM